MAKKCDCCGKGIGFGEYPVKDGTICGKCYNKYTKAGFEYKKKHDIEEDENGKIGSTTFAYYQYEIEGKTYEESLEVGVDKSKRNLDVYKKGNGEWEVYLKNPKRHFASHGL